MPRDNNSLEWQLSEKISQDSKVISSNLDILVEGRIAYFTGQVHSLESKERLEEIAKEFKQINSIVNNVELALN